MTEMRFTRVFFKSDDSITAIDVFFSLSWLLCCANHSGRIFLCDYVRKVPVVENWLRLQKRQSSTSQKSSRSRTCLRWHSWPTSELRTSDFIGIIFAKKNIFFNWHIKQVRKQFGQIETTSSKLDYLSRLIKFIFCSSMFNSVHFIGLNVLG